MIDRRSTRMEAHRRTAPSGSSAAGPKPRPCEKYGLILGLLSASLLFAQDEGGRGPGRWQARSMVETKFGIVATSQTLASAAGAHILETGGNAIDAAIAANAVLGVVEPMSNGMGGDLFAIIYEAKTVSSTA
jgi:Gamma-glutamyltranspeptidase